MKDYDMEKKYHDGKANIVAHGSSKVQTKMATLITSNEVLLSEMSCMELWVGIRRP